MAKWVKGETDKKETEVAMLFFPLSISFSFLILFLIFAFEFFFLIRRFPISPLTLESLSWQLPVTIVHGSHRRGDTTGRIERCTLCEILTAQFINDLEH
jgi:hypothetical protein